MEEIIEAVANTNVPTIMTMSGIALLFLSLAGRFGTYIEIKAERQKFAAMAGAVVLLFGLALYAYPIIAFEDGPDPDDPPPGAGETQLSGNGGGQGIWIQAGAFLDLANADDLRKELIEADIPALVAPNDTFKFICPGYFTVLVHAGAGTSKMQSLLGRVQKLVPTAFPRDPETFDPSTCPKPGG